MFFTLPSQCVFTPLKLDASIGNTYYCILSSNLSPIWKHYTLSMSAQPRNATLLASGTSSCFGDLLKPQIVDVSDNGLWQRIPW